MKRSSLIGHVIELLKIIHTEFSPLDRVIAEYFRNRRYLGSHDRRFIADTVFNMVRNSRLLGVLIDQYISNFPKNDLLTSDIIKYLPLYAAYGILVAHLPKDRVYEDLQSRWQMFFPSNNLHEYLDWLIYNQSLDFLRNNEVNRLGIQYSFQDWMVTEWQNQFGSEVENLLKSLNTPASVVLRVNTLRTTRHECKLRLEEEEIETNFGLISPDALIAKKRFHLESTKAFRNGYFEIQDEGSQMISLIANPQPGQFVIDACAGAGGKSLHLAALMQNEGKIIAIDVDKSRLHKLKARAERAGVSIIHTRIQSQIDTELSRPNADMVLVDSPCSGVGTIRRNPHLKWTVTENLVANYAERQRAILNSSSKFVKVGGRLVYATCSILRQENENIVESFLKANDNFTLIEPPDIIRGIKNATIGKYVKFLPQIHGTDGFFTAVFNRIG